MLVDSRIEQALKEGSPHLRLLADQLPVMIVLIDAAGKVVFVNTRLQAYLGRSMDDLSGWAWQECLHPDDRERAGEALTKALAAGEPYRLKIRFLHAPSGEHRWNLVEAVPVHDQDGVIASWVYTITDVHLQILAQERQGVLVDLGSYALQGHDLPALMRHAAQLVCQNLQMDFCSILELLPDRKELLLTAGIGWPEDLLGKARVGSGPETQAGYTLRTEGPVVARNLQSETRFRPAALVRKHGAVSGLSVRINTPDGPYGVIGTHAREERVYSESDVSFLQSVANVLGEAVQRSKAEEALQLSEARLRALFSNTSQSFVLLDPDGVIVMANPVANARAKLIAGREMEPGDHISDFLLSEDKSELRKNLARARAGETVSLERSIPTVGGDDYWFTFTHTPISEGGEVVGISFSAIDITERKRVEEKLRASEERFRLVFDNAAVGIALLAPERRYLDANERMCDMLGYTREEFLRLPPTHFGHTEDEWRSAEAFRRLVEGGVSSARYEKRFLRKDGGVLWGDVTVSLVRSTDGEPRYFIAALQDVTARKQAEEALRESERNFRSVFENAAVGVARVSVDGTFIEVNDRLCEELGYPREELVRLTFQEITHAEDLQADVRQAGALARGEIDSYQMEKRYLCKGGRTVWVQLTGSAVRDENGEILFFVAIIENIDARREAEEGLQELNETLERRVAERTVELQTLNAELESFAYSVSHDLRAPLRGIDGFAHALLEDYSERLDEVGRGYLERIRKGAGRMGELIDALLVLSRLSRGALQVVEVDLSQLVREIAGSLEERDPDREVTFEVAEGLVAPGDERLLRVALENLLENAWKFTRDQERARIEFGVTGESGQGRAYFVRDNGVGFDMRYAGKLFSPFGRLHSPQEFPGTGIGLATVQRIVHRHGGHVWGESAAGEGATFFFTLSKLSDRL
jgi:PAS domain S-box-containing protein